MIVYIETNFLMGTATGRDAYAYELFNASETHLQIAMPSVCIMEAWSAFEDERGRRHHFAHALNQQISQLRRDNTSVHAKSLLALLEQATIANESLLNDIQTRLRQIVQSIAGTGTASARVLLLPLTLNPAFFGEWSMHDPTDHVILATVRDHALQNPGEEKVLLTGNSKHFDTTEVRAVLSEIGIDRYFARTEAFLGWFRAQPAL